MTKGTNQRSWLDNQTKLESHDKPQGQYVVSRHSLIEHILIYGNHKLSVNVVKEMRLRVLNFNATIIIQGQIQRARNISHNNIHRPLATEVLSSYGTLVKDWSSSWLLLPIFVNIILYT